MKNEQVSAYGTGIAEWLERGHLRGDDLEKMRQQVVRFFGLLGRRGVDVSSAVTATARTSGYADIAELGPIIRTLSALIVKPS